MNDWGTWDENQMEILEKNSKVIKRQMACRDRYWIAKVLFV